MPLWILRGLFIFVAIGAAAWLSNTVTLPADWSSVWLVLIFLGVLLGAFAVVIVDVLIPRKRIDLISSLYFGLLVGLVLTFLLRTALFPLEGNVHDLAFRNAVTTVMAISLCYICISVLLQTKDNFRFIIPYAEFVREIKGGKPYVLDTSAIIDGRIADVIETGIIDQPVILPRFVLAELQTIADSSDKLRRTRGRRGLDVLNRLRTSELVDFRIDERETPEMAGQPVDMKLVLLAKHVDGKVVTGDANLNKVAKLQNVPVVNLNDLSAALRPVFLPGELFNVRVVRAGEEAGQGVGFLDDGTMVVVEGARESVGRTIRLTVTSVLQTSNGRMIFGRFMDEVSGRT